MPRITPVDWRTLVAVFELAGFTLERQRGSHMVYVKPGILRPVIIPRYREIAEDIILGNLRTAGIDRKTYLELLARVRG